MWPLGRTHLASGSTLELALIRLDIIILYHQNLASVVGCVGKGDQGVSQHAHWKFKRCHDVATR
jgi:hypothetical protein